MRWRPAVLAHFPTCAANVLVLEVHASPCGLQLPGFRSVDQQGGIRL
jgi:hypothetical protein